MAAAVDAGLLAITPCRNVPLPKVEHREMRLLSPADLAHLAAVVNPRYRALVLLGGYGGLRIGELAGLRRARVDVLRSRLDVAEKIVEVRGELLAGGPKTRAGRRQVPLHLERFVGPEPDTLLFAGPDGGALRAGSGGPDTGRRPWPRPTWHRFGRTTCATPTWLSGSPRERARSRSPPGPATRPCPSSWTAMATLFPGHEQTVMERLEAGYAAPVAHRPADVRALEQ
jgi:hypothetical protein